MEDWCLWSHKDTNLKAIHNAVIDQYVVCGCLWSHKDTNLKAIHNTLLQTKPEMNGVYGHTKILI